MQCKLSKFLNPILVILIIIHDYQLKNWHCFYYWLGPIQMNVRGVTLMAIGILCAGILISFLLINFNLWIIPLEKLRFCIVMLRLRYCSTLSIMFMHVKIYLVTFLNQLLFHLNLISTRTLQWDLSLQFLHCFFFHMTLHQSIYHFEFYFSMHQITTVIWVVFDQCCSLLC